jgi:ABC-type antimicrobial peptide transport system permease subunit
MYRHYMKSTLRFLVRQKTYVTLSVVGLAVGLACCFLITLWILDELSFDRFHEDADRIHMVLAHGTILNNPSTPIPLGPALEGEIPEVVAAARYESLGTELLGRGATRHYQPWVRAVDPAFFEIFSFEFLEGNPGTALSTPESIVISEDVARKFFGEQTPMGQTLSYNNERDVVVTGVFRNLPDNSTFHFEVAVPFEVRISDAEALGHETGWGTFSPFTFVRICDECSDDEVNVKLEDFLALHDPDEDVSLSILPLTALHGMFTESATYTRILAVIALFVLLIACINHVNLATARSTTRAREIGIRKTVGGSRGELATQFLVESGLLTLVSGVAALALVELLLPLFNEVTGKEVSLHIVRYPALLPLYAGLLVLTAVASGAYPAFVVSAFPPNESLQGRLSLGGNAYLRRSLIVLQFSLSVFLVASTVVVYRQLGFLQNMDVGYNRDRLVAVSLAGSTRRQYPVMKETMLRSPDVLAVTGMASGLPYFSWSTGTADWPGKDPEREILIHFNYVGYDFSMATGVRLIEGRDFSRDHPADVGSRALINETMARVMGLDSPVGSTITLWDEPREVIGIMNDFNFRPMHSTIGPLVFLLDTAEVSDMLVLVRPGAEQAAVEMIRDTFQSVIPMFPPVYSFVEDDLIASYGQLRRMGTLAGAFALLAVLIACLGVVGLSSYAAERRAKEIGVRKVLGASVAQIVGMMSRELLLLVGLANVLAWPAAYVVMSRLLEAYAYRVEIGWVPFVLAMVLALTVTLFTVVPLAARAASRDPVEVLRYE